MRALKTRTAVAGCWKSTMTKWEQSAQLILLQLHAAAAKSLQSCPTLCNPTDGSPPGRLPRPWDSPDKNTGLGCHFLLQCMKVKSESEVTQSCPTLNNPMDCSLPGSSAHGIFQARVLEWVVIAFSVQLHETLPKNSASTILLSLALKQIGKVKELNNWAPHELTANKKTCCYFLLFYPTTMNHFSIELWCVTKSGFYMTTGGDWLSGWTEKKLQSTSQSQICTKKRSWSLVVCCSS